MPKLSDAFARSVVTPLRGLAFRSAAAITPVIVAERDNIRYYLNTHDREICRKIFTTGSFERTAMDAAFRAMSQLNGEKFDLAGKTFLDLGANIGSATLLALLRYDARTALAVEPDPENFVLLQNNLLANGIQERVTAVRRALSDRPGEVLLALSEKNRGNNILTRDPHGLPAEWARTIAVQAVRLDDLLAAEGVEPGDIGMCWIDVEGYEAHLLRGAGSLLAAEVPTVAEFWPYGLELSGGYDELCAAVRAHYTAFVDLRRPFDEAGAPITRPAGSLGDLRAVYQGRECTELLLVP
ncbi:FkbM family methyltransferase [Streptomyces hainanensis]|uniref:FkbM family methyltransferase n=1 Tax=Streptomyces hainanensis TaxID=402648 RepID=A0A4R4SKR9_9ACTN|nr:FkbM family methyltransferase [Streptomyces hainanensis]TDC62143.1 FkbM family methyltransferase [Streptomyces hainanensis]